MCLHRARREAVAPVLAPQGERVAAMVSPPANGVRTKRSRNTQRLRHTSSCRVQAMKEASQNEKHRIQRRGRQTHKQWTSATTWKDAGKTNRRPSTEASTQRHVTETSNRKKQTSNKCNTTIKGTNEQSHNLLIQASQPIEHNNGHIEAMKQASHEKGGQANSTAS